MDLFNLNEEKKEEEKSSKPIYTKSQKRKGIVSSILAGKWVIIDVNGQGERVKYSEKEHSSLKVGDSIEIAS